MYYDEPIAENKYQFTIPAGYTDYVLCVPSGTWRVTIDADGFERWASDKDYVDYTVAAGVTVFTAPIDENEIQLSSTRLTAKEWEGNGPSGELEVEVTPSDVTRYVTVTPVDPVSGEPYQNEIRFVPGNAYAADVQGNKFDYFMLPDPVRGNGNLVLPEYRAIARYKAQASNASKKVLIFRHWAAVVQHGYNWVDLQYSPGDTVPSGETADGLELYPVFYSVSATNRSATPVPDILEPT